MSVKNTKLRGLKGQARLIDEQRRRRAGRSAVIGKGLGLQEDAETLGLASAAEVTAMAARIDKLEAALKAAGLMT